MDNYEKAGCRSLRLCCQSELCKVSHIADLEPRQSHAQKIAIRLFLAKVEEIKATTPPTLARKKSRNLRRKLNGLILTRILKSLGQLLKQVICRENVIALLFNCQTKSSFFSF